MGVYENLTVTKFSLFSVVENLNKTAYIFNFYQKERKKTNYHTIVKRRPSLLQYCTKVDSRCQLYSNGVEYKKKDIKLKHFSVCCLISLK